MDFLFLKYITMQKRFQRFDPSHLKFNELFARNKIRSDKIEKVNEVATRFTENINLKLVRMPLIQFHAKMQTLLDFYISCIYGRSDPWPLGLSATKLIIPRSLFDIYWHIGILASQYVETTMCSSSAGGHPKRDGSTIGKF